LIVSSFISNQFFSLTSETSEDTEHEQRFGDLQSLLRPAVSGEGSNEFCGHIQSDLVQEAFYHD
jgi:hypothetical protein